MVQYVGKLLLKLEVNMLVDLIEEYDDLFYGLGKFKDYQIKFYIDENILFVV